MRAPQDKREKERNDRGPLDYNCWNQAGIHEDSGRERADTNSQRHELQSPEKHLVTTHLDAQRRRCGSIVSLTDSRLDGAHSSLASGHPETHKLLRAQSGLAKV